MPLRFGIGKKGSGANDRSDRRDQTIVEPSEEALKGLQSSIGYDFKDGDLLKRALTHRSAYQQKNVKGSRPDLLENSDETGDYERLEFLGDAVLDLAVAALLLETHPEAREGELSKMRAALVNTKSLAEIGIEELKLGECIILSRSELASGGASRPSILADVFEALLGAIYRDSDYATVLPIVSTLFGSRITEVTPSDPKTELQEALHALGCGEPSYYLEHREGPEHSPIFVSVVEIDGLKVGAGRGPTKKASQQKAAAEALELISAKDEIDELYYVSN